MRQKTACKTKRNANRLTADNTAPCDGADRNIRHPDEDAANGGNIDCIDASGLSPNDLDELKQQLELRRSHLKQQIRDSPAAGCSDSHKTSVDACGDVLTRVSSDEQHSAFIVTTGNTLAPSSGSEAADASSRGNNHHITIQKESGILLLCE